MATETARYDIVLGFKADVEAAKKQLYDLQQNIDKITNKDFSINFNNNKVKAGFDETSKKLITLNKILNKSMNLDTGKLNLNKLISETKAYNIDIVDLTNNLATMGEAGEVALENITKLIADGDTKAINLNKSIERMGEQLIRTAKIQLSYTVLDKFTSVFRDSYSYAQELNESLNNIRIVTNKSKTDMSRFAVEANKAAKALSTTTTAYTDAALIYYQQGLNDDAVKERTDATVKLANVTGQSASEVSSYMTAIWNNYDNGSKSLEYYADVITALGAATASSSEEIAQGLSQFSAVANTVGLSYEYASSALATVVAQTRLSADTVGTSFKTIFARLQSLNLGETLDDDTTLTKYTKAMDKVGVSIKNQDGTLKSMDAILDSLGTKWSQLSQEQKNGLAYTVAGARQYTNFIALMDNWQQMQANVNIAEMSEGTLTRQQRIYEESWEAANKRLKASFESLYDSIINDDAFITLTNGLSKLIELINQVVKGFGGFEGTLGILASTATKLFRAPLTSWFSGLINTVNQAYAIASKQSKKLQQEYQQYKIQGSKYYKDNKETELSQEYEDTALNLEKQREEYLAKVQREGLGSTVVETANNRYNQLQKELIAKFDTLQLLQDKGIPRPEQNNYSKSREEFNTEQSLRAKLANIDNIRNSAEDSNLLIEEIKKLGAQLVELKSINQKDLDKILETNSFDEYVNFAQDHMSSEGDIADPLLKEAIRQKEAYQSALNLESVQGTDIALQIINHIAKLDEDILTYRNILGITDEQEPEVSNNLKPAATERSNNLETIITLLQKISDNISKNSSEAEEDKQKNNTNEEEPQNNNAEVETKDDSAENIVSEEQKQETITEDANNEEIVKNTDDIDKKLDTIVDNISRSDEEKATDSSKKENEILEETKNINNNKEDNKNKTSIINNKSEKREETLPNDDSEVEQEKQHVSIRPTNIKGGRAKNLKQQKRKQNKKREHSEILDKKREKKSQIEQQDSIQEQKNINIEQKQSNETQDNKKIQAQQKVINKEEELLSIKTDEDTSNFTNRYDNMASSITKAIDLTSTMISLNATLGNTIEDLSNGDFSNLIGDISALAISFGNTYNTVAQLKASLKPEEWNALTGPLKAISKGFKKIGDNSKRSAADVATGTGAIVTGEQSATASTLTLSGAIKKFWSSVLGPIIIIQGAIALFKLLIEGITKYIDEHDPKKRLQRLQDTTEDLKNVANEAAQAYENISSKINNLDTAADKIETLTKGTIEWKNAVAENNREVLELLNSYDMLDSKYLDTSGDYYKITDLGKDELQNRAYQNSRRATALYTASLLNTKEAEYAISENDTQVENRKSFNSKVNLTSFKTPINLGNTSNTMQAALGNSEAKKEYDEKYASIVSNSYESVIKALELDNDGQFESLEEFTNALAQTGLDEATIQELGEQLFPEGVKDEVLKSLEEEKLSRDKNTESLDILTKEMSRNLLEVDFNALGISSEVFNNAEFTEGFNKIYDQAKQDAAALNIDSYSDDNRKLIAKLFGGTDATYDKENERWEVNGQNYSLDAIREAYALDQIENGDYKQQVIDLGKQIQKDYGYKTPIQTTSHSTDGTIEKDIETWKLNKNAIDEATEALYKMYEAQGMTEEQAKRIVVANEKLNAAYSDLIDNFKNYNIALKNNEQYSSEYQTALKSLRKDVSALFDINEDLVSEDFLTNPENLKLLEQFQYGNLNAGDELQKRLAYSLDLDISEESQTKLNATLDTFYEHTKNNPLEIGMTLDSTEALQGLLDVYSEMLKSGEMTAEQVTAALSAIGFEPEIEWVEPEVAGIDMISYTGTVKVISADGKNEDILTHYSDEAEIANDSKILIPRINPKTSYRGKPSNTISGTNKQKAAKNAASNKPKTKKVDDEKKRYYEINQELAKLNDQLNKITKAKDRAFGKEKLGYLDQEISKYKDLEKAQQKYLDEVNSYLSKDMGTLAAYGAQFNDDGTLANYDELISKQVAQYNATANAENSNADEVYSNFTKALSNYEDSLSKSREVLNQLIDYQNQIYDLKLEKLVYKVEYKVEINDKDLERLEWLLSNISDKAFKSAESIALMSKQMADYQSSFETVNKGIDEWFANHTEISAEMKDAFLNGTMSADELASKLNTLTTAEKDQLYAWSSQLMQLVENMEQVKQAIQDQLLKSFDDLAEKVGEQVNRLDTLNQIMSSYIEIAKLVGKENLGVSDELMKQMRQNTINLSTQQVNILRKEYEATKEELDKLLSTPGVDQETINQAKQKVSEIYANLLSQTQNTVSAIQQMFADTMQDIADDFSKKMGGVYGSISELQLAYDRQKNLNDGYLETYQKSYELAKLARDINKSINDTDSLKGKQLLLSLEDEITQRQANRTKMSEYELNFLQKKYELYQAQIALEEAQNAKSQVRMTRDANGNMSYTYTADQEAIDKAEQGYNDALYNLMNLNQEQLQANQEKILSIVSEYYQSLIDMGYDQQEASKLTNEYYQELMAQTRDEMDMTLGHASWIVEEFGVEEDLLIDKFDETVLAHITGTQTMEEFIDNWEVSTANAINATNTNYQDFQTNLNACLTAAELDSQAFADAVDADMAEVNDALVETENETDKLVDTFKEDFDKALGYVKDFDNKYAKFLENMRQNTNTLVEALNNLIKGFAELDGRAANVINTSKSKISAAEVELETQSSGSSTPEGQFGGNGGEDKYKFYFGNTYLGESTDERSFHSKVNEMTGIRTSGITRYITKSPSGDIYLYTDSDNNIKLTRTLTPHIVDAFGHTLKKFDTGGYTGDWASKEGKLAVLHQKELVLNENDTSNVLEVVNIVRNLADTISNLTYRDKMESLLNNIRNIYDHIYDNIKIENSQNMDQYVTIQADFPSVSSQVEIEAAFENILLHASQYANRKA